LDVYGRVARLLLDLAKERDGVLVIENKPTQQEMASRVAGSARKWSAGSSPTSPPAANIEVERDRIVHREVAAAGLVGRAIGHVN